MGYWTVHHDLMPQFIDALINNCRDAVDATAQAVTDEAKAFVPSIEQPGPFATSALRTAIHWNNPHFSQYAEATSDARHVRDSAPDYIKFRGVPRNEVPLDPFITPPEPVTEVYGQIKSVVYAPLDYAYFVELGGFSESVLPGRAEGPFMAPAADGQADHHVSRVINAVKEAVAASVGKYHEGAQREMWEAKELAKLNAEANRQVDAGRERLRGTTAWSKQGGQKRARAGKGKQRETFGEMWERVYRDAQDELDRHGI